MVILAVKPCLKAIYDKYFCPAFSQDNMIKAYMKVLKEFDISPYLISQKICFMVLYFTINENETESNLVCQIKE